MEAHRWAGVARMAALAIVLSACAAPSQVSPAPSAAPTAQVLDGPGAERLAAAWVAERHGIDAGLVRFAARGSRDRRWFAKVVAPAPIALIVWVDLDTGEIGEGEPFPPPDPTLKPRLGDVDLALLEALDPGEPVNAWVTAVPGRAESLVLAARTLGLSADLRGGDELFAIGASGAIRVLLGLGDLASMTLEERRDPGRPIARAIASEALPRPGFPYLERGFPQDSVRTSGEPIPPAATDGILAALRPVVSTADGRPYDELRVAIDCDGRPTACRVVTSGGPRWSGGSDGPHEDVRVFSASAADGWLLHPDRAGPDETRYGAMPRSLVRQAERIAREDPAAGPVVLSSARLRGWRWFPWRPGIVELAYDGTAVRALVEGRLTASTGERERQVLVEVDAYRGVVSRVVEVPAAA